MTPELLATIAEIDRNQRLLIALDFDGTLSHLVPQPHLARPVAGALHVLERLSGAPDTEVALISGRALADLAMVSGAQDVALLIGSHGQEVGSDVALDDVESAVLHGLRKGIARRVGDIPGAMVEDKPAGFAVHYRHCSEEDGQVVVEAARALAAAHKGTNVIEGKLVIELSVRPLDKGSALAKMIRDVPQRRVLFAGDDVTDETAMAVLRDSDIGIKVGTGESHARYRVPGPDEMVNALEEIADARGV